MGRRAGAATIHLPAGRLTYLACFTVGRRRYRVSTREADPDRALEAAQKLAAESELHGRPLIRQRVSHANQTALETLSAEYLAHVEASASAGYFTKQAMHFRAHFLPRWTRLPDALAPGAIDRYRQERSREKTNRKTKISSVTVYKELVTLSMFFRWCKRQGYIGDVPEFDRARPVSSYEAPDLSQAQIAALLAELPRREQHPKRMPVYEYHAVQWSQGMRPGEVATLRWTDVDLDRKLVTIRQRHDKARSPDRVLGMSALTHAVLTKEAETRGKGAGLIFGRRTFRASIKLAAARAGLPHVTPHHLRHARLSELASKSQDVAALQLLAGHKHLSTTDRYVRSRTARTADLLAAADSVNVSVTGAKKGTKRRSTRRG